MTRRITVVLAALVGVIGVLLLSSSPVSAQVGFPGFDIAALLRSVFNSFPPFLQGIIGPLFSAILGIFGGGCIPPFCAS